MLVSELFRSDNIYVFPRTKGLTPVGTPHLFTLLADRQARSSDCLDIVE